MLTDMERTVIRQIKKHHGLNSGTPVRLFPRDVDAALLGGLGQIVGPGYMRHRTIHARYRLAGNRVTVGEIRADSEDRPGGIVLPRTQNCD